MSRIDDDSAARRAAERLALQKRTDEQKAQRTQQESSAFSKLMQQGKQQAQAQSQTQQQAPRPGSLAHQVLAEATRAELSSGSQVSDQNPLRKSAFQELMAPQEQGATTQGQLGEMLQTEARGAESTQRGRTEDARGGDERLEERGAEHGKTSDVLAGRRGGELRTSGDKGQSGQGGGSQDGKKDSGADKAGGAAFRFNPALMAPVGIAKPKDIPSSDRLRQIASEIAQKIVERVRVGTNAVGASEFQIDLRSNVLSGLSIKLSAQNGKIKATFSGNNREVLKLLGEHAGALKEALGKRGLTLEDLRIEEKA